MMANRSPKRGIAYNRALRSIVAILIGIIILLIIYTFI